MNYNHTQKACFTGFVVQAIVNNFAPMLFLCFQDEFQIPLSQITFLITINFAVQLTVDLISVKYIDKIGYRPSIVAALFFSATGLICLTFLPNLLGNAFVGLLVSVVTYAIGGGLLEVIVSPIVEACPTDNKEKAMSLLHSFYCWGTLAVVVVSTIFFTVFGIHNWRIMAIIWAIVPILNGILFTKVPIASVVPEGVEALSVKQLFTSKIFWVFLIIMMCAGASELSISQWASTFAEKGLGITKTLGDLAGPALFAVLMGISRTVYGRIGEKINLNKFMLYSGILCVISYLVMSLIPNPIVSLIACGLTGLSVGIMWPGTFSMAAASIKGGGTAMFAFMALAGDLGCSAGPTLVGVVSGALGDNLQMGILAAAFFPLLLIVVLLLRRKNHSQ